MRLHQLIVLMIVASALSACAAQAPQQASVTAGQPIATSNLDGRTYDASPGGANAMAQAPSVTPARLTKPVTERPYTLDAGDKLRVVVFGQQELSNSYSVGADGAVTLPLIGAVSARGRTTVQLSNAIAARLKKGFVRDPSVAVQVETYRPFFVLGEVTYPGQYPYVPNMTAEAAVAIAGGFTPRARKDDVEIQRSGRDGATRYSTTLQGAVRPGDTITVAERWF